MGVSELGEVVGQVEGDQARCRLELKLGDAGVP
jgi:hypothetical protein